MSTERKEWLEIENFKGKNPCLTYSYPSRPSWKAYGGGRGWVKITINNTGSLTIRAQEIPDGIKGMKDVFVHLSVEARRGLEELLKACPPPTPKIL